MTPNVNFPNFMPPPMLPPVPGQITGQASCRGACYYCGGFGHMQRDCQMTKCFRISFRDIKAEVTVVVVDLVGPEVLEVAEKG